MINKLVQKYSTPYVNLLYCEPVLFIGTKSYSFEIGLECSDKMISISLVNNASYQNQIIYNMISSYHSKPTTKLNSLVKLLVNIAQNPTHYCSSCGKILEFQTDEFSTCGYPNCQYSFEELFIGNPITQRFEEQPEMVMFLIESAFMTITSPNGPSRFDPFPSHFLLDQGKKMLFKRGNVHSNSKLGQYKNFDLLKKIVGEFPVAKLETCIKESSNDNDLRKLIGDDAYRLVRFIITTCVIYLKQNTDVSNSKLKLYEVIYPMDKVSFPQTKTFLFHGSHITNWYSIMRNGLKNCSKSALMQHGAVYGDGIYLSDSYKFAAGYSSYDNKTAVGVFEIGTSDVGQFNKTTNIFVIQDENLLLLRYIILCSGVDSASEYIIKKYFGLTIQEEKKHISRVIFSKGARRLHREYKKILKNDCGLEVVADTDDLYKWTVFVKSFPPDCAVYQDMQKYGIKQLQVEITFPYDFPFGPPFVRIVSPRFQRLTGHVTTFGALCMEILTSNNWVSTCSIESLIVTIISEIVEGDGRLDPTNYAIPYDEKEAKESFFRVSRSHGWL